MTPSLLVPDSPADLWLSFRQLPSGLAPGGGLYLFTWEKGSVEDSKQQSHQLFLHKTVFIGEQPWSDPGFTQAGLWHVTLQTTEAKCCWNPQTGGEY